MGNWLSMSLGVDHIASGWLVSRALADTSLDRRQLEYWIFDGKSEVSDLQVHEFVVCS